MKVFSSSEALPKTYQRGFVCLGNFDGVHLGHQKIIDMLAQDPRREEAPTLVYTFWPHPAKLLVPKAAPKMIQTPEQKIKALAALAVDAVIFEPFDAEFSRLSAREFFDEILVARLAAKGIAVGYDFHFGYRRMGNAEVLRRWGEEAGIPVLVVEPVFHEETLISSSAIRRLLMDGEVEEAAELLGRPYEYIGKVVPGDARGASIGFPTANLDGINEMLMKEGVYATWATVDGERYPSVSNIGNNPTFVGERPIHVEVHLLDFNGDLYGKNLAVSFVKRLRGEQHFKDIAALRAQIGQDIKQSRKILKP